MGKIKPNKRRIAEGNANTRQSKTTLEHEALSKVLTNLKELDARMNRIELHLGLEHTDPLSESNSTNATETSEESEEALESEVGENWFAKVGIVVLALGVVFLLTFPYQNLPSYAPSAIGYALVGAILLLSRYWKESFQQVSRYLLGGGLVLLYFTTLRLSHFSPEPALANTTIELILLIAVVIFNLAISVRKHSSYLTAVNLFLLYLSALAGGGSMYVFIVLAVAALISSYLSVYYQWHWVLPLGIVLALLTHFLWSMNNPVFGNPFQQISTPQINLLFILTYATVFATGSLAEAKTRREDALAIAGALLNGFGSSLLLTFIALTSFKSTLAAWSIAASGFYLAFAIAFWIRSQSKYTTFIYAMLGYCALSIAIVDTFAAPDVYVWLCWQSILVISTAVWFRSRFIVVANFFIYLIVLIAYLSLAGTVSTISVSFGIVALLSARILNWRKDRLELKTEMMRNAYLACALFVMPYALYRVVPHGYVSVSWLGLALFYYIASRLLHNNRKYRWMALLTIVLTVLYVFAVELVGLDPTLRIISFLLLGIALLTISMIYSRKRLSR